MANSAIVQGYIDSIKVHRRQFQSFCYSLTDEQLERPVPDSTWVVKDFISHLATLDAELTRWFETAAKGEPDDTVRDMDGQPTDIDSWNEKQVAERRSWPLEKIFDEAAENRAKLIAAMEELTDENIDQVMHFAGDKKRPAADIPLKMFMGGWTRHDPIHVADMLKALPEKADDPEVQAWLDDSIVKWYQQTMAGPAKS